jgi:hypothetical protein
MPGLENKRNSDENQSLKKGLLEHEHSAKSKNSDVQKENYHPSTGFSGFFQRLLPKKAKADETSSYDPPRDLSKDPEYHAFRKKGREYEAKQAAEKEVNKRGPSGP